MIQFIMKSDRNGRDAFAYTQSDHIDNRVLAANTPEVHPVPSGAKYALIRATTDVWVKVGAAAAVPSGDSSGGDGSEINPGLLWLNGATTIGLVAEATCKVSLSFYA